MQILRAKPEDATTLTRIALAAKRHWGYPEPWIEKWRHLLTVGAEFIVQHETYVAVADSLKVGFYALDQHGNNLELLHLWVLPEAMGRGVGRSLFQHALKRARSLGFPALEIESDPNAEGVYRHLGAHRVGTIVSDLGHERRELPILVCET